MAARQRYTTASAYLTTADCAAAIDRYVRHLGANERYRLEMPDGKIAHAELQIGDCIVMLSDEFTEMGTLSPQTLGGSPLSLNVYVDDADATFAAMLADGASELFEVKDQFHGDRSGKLRDPFGHIWHIASNTEDFSSDEIVKRFQSMMGG